MSDTSTNPLADATLQSAIDRVFDAQKQNQFVVARMGARERIAKLRRLHDALLEQRQDIYDALWADLRKSPTEVDISEIGVINSEIRHAIRHLRSWMSPKSVATPMPLFGTRSEIRYEPKGVCLILSPWNYPFNLTLAPLVSAIAAGNTAILKPSEFTPNSNVVLRRILASLFAPEEVAIFEGEANVAQALLNKPFNHVFFTGSPAVGKMVMRAAAQHLSSVTLELGGKSPVIVDENANLEYAAGSIAWLKAMNAGQICIAPDYLLVHENVRDALLEKLAASFKRFYGETPEARKTSPDLCRMISDKQFNRMKGLLADALEHGGRVVFGGGTDDKERYVEPTLLVDVPDTANIWDEEVFGPILPIRTFKTPEEAVAYVNAKPQPLALYIFSTSKRNTNFYQNETRTGNTVVNDTGVHFYNSELPFGGVNNSGIGKSHGLFGFLEFSNPRGVVYQNRLFPLTRLFQPPYGNRISKIILLGLRKYF
ncbi:MAG: aldehyde dehydrogenase family protein [Saprospiraceae bacterium]|nr:aldehyde dehydrogenase family protein [Saprospiraceae bacterium]